MDGSFDSLSAIVLSGRRLRECGRGTSHEISRWGFKDEAGESRAVIGGSQPQ
jgi:hypothetical protein